MPPDQMWHIHSDILFINLNLKFLGLVVHWIVITCFLNISAAIQTKNNACDFMDLQFVDTSLLYNVEKKLTN